MSLTVNDAQFLSWKTFKKFQKGSDQTAFENAEQLLKKAQEITQKINSSQQQGSKVDKEDMGPLLAGLLNLAFILAEQHGVSLEDSFMEAIDDYIMGFMQ